MTLHHRLLSFGVLFALLFSTLSLAIVPEARASGFTPPVRTTGSSNAPEAAALTCPSLLLNPGFESVTNGIPNNWLSNGKGSIGATGAYNEPDGSMVGYTWTNPSGTGTPAQMYQDITATPGALYTMTFYSGTHDPNINATIAIRFYNSGGTEVGTPAIHVITHDLDDSNLGGPNLLSATAPADAAKLRVVFTDPSASGVAAAAKGDSMCLHIADYGDAPDTASGDTQGNYRTTATDDGPYHVIIPNLRLGTVAPDTDNGTLQNTGATADNLDNTNDEDGVSTLPVVTTSSSTVSLTVNVFNDTNATARVACWIDFNRDGDFLDTGERTAVTNVSDSSSQQNINLSFSGFAAPTAGMSYLRCRIANASGDVTNSVGGASSGEVEDYALPISMDLGDAPDTGSGTGTGNYQTTAADGGPSHIITSNIKMGTATTDADNGTLQNTAATADDTNGTTPDDEDGITTLPTITTATTSVTLTVRGFTSGVGSISRIACWIDFNRDGVFGDTASGERAQVDVPDNSNTTFNLTFTPVGAPVAGQSYIRCRIADLTSEVNNPTGAANTGEVEDYAVTITALDYGDAPDTGSGTGTGNYQTTASDGGPNHVITANLRLGTATTDADNGTLQNTAATSDNTTGTNDEDGVSTMPVVTPLSTSVSLTVNVFNNSGNTATVACWIDFNRDGDFGDTGERASTTVSSSASQQNINLTFSGFATPSAGTSYLRCRVANTASEVTSSVGAATTGEVEDYQFSIVNLDYGDAPDTGSGTGTGNYNTTQSDNGPSHVLTTNLRMGTATTDADNGTLQNTAATSDNTTGTNDEDGVSTLPTITSGSTSVSLTVNVFNNSGSTATLACWIDFNRDGDFTDTGERTSATVNSSGSQQNINLTFTGFSPPTVGTTYLRCRIANTAGEVTNPTGLANTGEIEDYQVTVIAVDFGDAPDTGSGTGTGNYNTRASDNGPYHVITSNLRLGTATTDADNGTLQNTGATMDNNTGTNDEDGVATIPNVNITSTSVPMTVNVFNNSGSNATLACWMDMNRDGDFSDAGERASSTVSSSGSQQQIQLIFSGFATPTPGTSYFRCRIANTAGEVTNPTGAASTGEVEDYQFTIFNHTTNAELLTFAAKGSANKITLRWATGSEANVVGFNVWRAGAGSSEFAQVNPDAIAALSTGELHGNDYTYDDTNVDAGSKYTYKLEILKGTGESGWSDTLVAKAPAASCQSKLTAPLLVGPENNAKLKRGKITLTWNPVNCAVKYRVELRAGSPDGTVITDKTIKKTKLSSQKLAAGTTYYWRVSACNQKGKCVAGEWWSFKIRNEKN